MNTTYRREPDVHPPLDSPASGSTRLRAPARSPLVIPHTLSEVTGPALGERDLGPLDADRPRQHAGEPLGERMILHGRVVDGNGRAVPHTLVELWQANAAGRYLHGPDPHPAPLGPNFSRAGPFLPPPQGNHRFLTNN